MEFILTSIEVVRIDCQANAVSRHSGTEGETENMSIPPQSSDIRLRQPSMFEDESVES